jgi:hypothetical protein
LNKPSSGKTGAVQAAAAGVFLLVIVGILLSVRMRARVGLQAIAALQESTPRIARSLADRRPALSVIDETVKRLPSQRNHDLDLALSEIRAGLVRYQDDFSVGPDGRGGCGNLNSRVTFVSPLERDDLAALA